MFAQASVSEIISIHKTHTYLMAIHVHWLCNRKQIVYSAAGCLVTENTMSEAGKGDWMWFSSDENSIIWEHSNTVNTSFHLISITV